MTSITPWTQKMVQLIEEEEENKSPKTSNKHIDSLAPELVGRVFQSGLTVVDRLHCERVSPRWKWIVGAFGWSKQRKLNTKVTFEGASYEKKRRFTQANLISLLGRFAGPNLVELNFRSCYNIRFNLEIAESLSMFPNLQTDFVDFLPCSLLDLQTIHGLHGPFNVQNLRKLSECCPNLKTVPFREVDGLNTDLLNEFLGRFPRQKELDLLTTRALPNSATFEAIGRQKELVELVMQFRSDFDEETERAFEAMAEGCESLRKIHFRGVTQMTEQSLSHLAKMPSLTMVELCHATAPFTDSILKAIAKRGQLKKLKVLSNELTDEGIVCLMDQCKLLVSLELDYCPQITNRSLEAVVAENHRRHGTPKRALPTGPDDKRVFFFGCRGTQIDVDKAREMAAGNPWLEIIRNGFPGDPRWNL